MIVAGLDIATKTGVCFGEPRQTPQFFTENFGRFDDHDDRFEHAMRLCDNLVRNYGVTHIGIERPIVLRHRTQGVTELIFGLYACVRAWARFSRAEVIVASIGTIDKHFIGVTKLPSEERKQAIYDRCKLLGWEPNGLDESDAGAVWDYACAHFDRDHGANVNQMMGRK